MGYLNNFVWILPLSIHVGYFFATVFHFPAILKIAAGAATGTGGTLRLEFIIGWWGVVGAANLAFCVLIIWLPKMGDSMLSVPAKSYWLSSLDLKKELISRLRGVCAAALFGLNIFFLSVYQTIYQSHVPRPYITMSLPTLVVFFMVVPLLVSAISMVFTVRSLAVDGKRGEAGRN